MHDSLRCINILTYLLTYLLISVIAVDTEELDGEESEALSETGGARPRQTGGTEVSFTAHT